MPTQHSSRTPARQLLYELLELALGRDPISGLTRLRHREAGHVAVAAGGVQRHTVLDFFDSESASSLCSLLPSPYLKVLCYAPTELSVLVSLLSEAKRNTQQLFVPQAKGQRVLHFETFSLTATTMFLTVHEPAPPPPRAQASSRRRCGTA